MTHIPVKELPQALRDALRVAGYKKADIGVSTGESVYVGYSGGKGRRGGVMCVNLATGETSGPIWGSWGGPTIFGGENPVDDLDRVEPIHPNGAVICLVEGGGRSTLATVHVRPETLTPLLPAAPALTDRQRAILAVYGGLKSAYRQQELDRGNVTRTEIDQLVEGGFLARNKAGSTRITTAGKNARDGARVPYSEENWAKLGE